MIGAQRALERLREGNRRYAAELEVEEARTGEARRRELVQSQEPFAIILGCSDSRVPAETVFDQGLGDLFVIRVAGNIVGKTQLGSIEFAAEQFGSPLVVVMGHTRCGAVGATLKELEQPTEDLSINLQAIIRRVQPAIEGLWTPQERKSPEALLQRAVRANVLASVTRVREGSPLVARRMDEKKLVVVGAVYSLETGVVEFLESAAVGA